MISNLKKCKTCGFRGSFQDGTPACTKFKIKIDLNNDYCSWHIPENNITSCSICNQSIPINETLIWNFEDKTFLLCKNCYNLIGTCHTCAHQSECDFRSDHSEPQVVMRTVRQGMMTMQTQVKNPNLIRKHCLNCKCSYGTEGNCIKDEDAVACKNWSLLPELRLKGFQ